MMSKGDRMKYIAMIVSVLFGSFSFVLAQTKAKGPDTKRGLTCR